MATTILFGVISAIAISAIMLAAHLLDQRSKLRKALVSAGKAYAELEATNESLREEIHMRALREAAIIRHAEGLIAERNLLRAQLVAYSEPPRFGVVRRGSA